MLYRSTRGLAGAAHLTFEEAVMAGLAPDGGLYVPAQAPEALPDASELAAAWADLPFTEVAVRIFRRFIDRREISDADLGDLVRRSFATFAVEDVAPVVRAPIVPMSQSDSKDSGHSKDSDSAESNRLWILELFHGPTFAFKDVALQFLGNLFDFFLSRKNKNFISDSTNITSDFDNFTSNNNNFTSNNKENTNIINPTNINKEKKNKRFSITVVGATSGDTGGAAIFGLRGRPDISVFMLHPAGRISPVQQRQMTSVLDHNVHNVALAGSFDDCQDAVKALFSDAAFRDKHNLAAVNSINWARILAQISYYVYAYLSIVRAEMAASSNNSLNASVALPRIQFSVPTGNFGDILAGFYARALGLPIHRLIIATNTNDILHRFLDTGVYAKDPLAWGPKFKSGPGPAADLVHQTLAPAMDILVSSNFERLLWHLVASPSTDPKDIRTSIADPNAADRASDAVRGLMDDLRYVGGFAVQPDILDKARAIFASHRVDDTQITDAINRYYHVQFEPKTQPNASNASGIPPPSNGYVLDPHTAIGIVAAEHIIASSPAPPTSDPILNTVCLATASAGKFPEAVLSAINSNPPPASIAAGFRHLEFKDIAPPALVELDGMPVRCTHVTNGLAGIRHVIEATLGTNDMHH